ncbi:MAG: amino acid ABC transporter substrate-binding protein [Legionellales bacterium]|nr:amino acid ABC transporter substrate-binding protein [Legionellales bacterium]
MNIASMITVFVLIFICTGCTRDNDANTIVFAVSADYPPFEYVKGGKIVGFEIAFATLVAEKLGKKAKFEDMQFSSIFPAINSGTVDAGISTITITEERMRNFDFAHSHYKEGLVIVFAKDKPITEKSQLSNKKIACQLGTTMEMWLRKYALKTEIITTDNNLQAIESLKSGLVDGVLIDAIQGKVFVNKNKQLSYNFIAEADYGYGIALKKGSTLLEEINKVILILKDDGTLDKLKKKYLHSNL